MFNHHHRLPKHVDQKPAPPAYQAAAAPNLVAAWPGPNEAGGIDDLVGDLDVVSLPAGVTASTTAYGPGLNFADAGQVAMGSLAVPGDYTIFALVRHGTQSGLVLHAGEQTGIGFVVTPNSAFAVAKIGGETKGNLIPLGAGPTEWYALALTVAGTTGRLYVNGQAVWVGPAPAGANGAWQFGEGAFNGEIADGRIYNKALTADELKTIQSGANQWDAYRKPPPGVPERQVWRRVEGFGRRANKLRIAAGRGRVRRG